MAQNIYDNPEFFENYSRLPRSVEGLGGAPEWPALRALLPGLDGLRVLDLGCGFGWFCRWVREQGASYVLGIDVSEQMLARARAAESDAGITYDKTDLEQVGLPDASFDVAFSSLTFHYIEDLHRLLTKVHAALVPGGQLVFSAEHPVFTAPIRPGWSHDADDRKAWPLDSYLIEGPRVTDWLTNGVVKQHRTLGSYINLLLGVGFTISHVQEWGPTNEQIMAQPQLADELQRPTFLLVSARR
jgi:SAM-dependent methyltransferase